MQNRIREAKQALRDQVCAALKRIPPEQRAAASARARALLESTGPVANGAVGLVLCAVAGGTGCLAAAEPAHWPRASKSPCPVLWRRPAATRPAGFLIRRRTFGQGILEFASRAATVRAFARQTGPDPGSRGGIRPARSPPGPGQGILRPVAGVWRGTTCGVAFEEQIVDEIPLEPHDVRLDYVLTPTVCVAGGRLRGSPETVKPARRLALLVHHAAGQAVFPALRRVPGTLGLVFRLGAGATAPSRAPIEPATAVAPSVDGQSELS